MYSWFGLEDNREVDAFLGRKASSNVRRIHFKDIDVLFRSILFRIYFQWLSFIKRKGK